MVLKLVLLLIIIILW